MTTVTRKSSSPPIYAVLWFACRMSAKRTRSVAPTPTAAHAHAIPSSALNAVYTWRRVLADAGCQLPNMRATLKVLKGLNAEFISDFGAEALASRKQQPIPRAALVAAFKGLDARGVNGWCSTVHIAMSTLVAWALVSGSRKDQLTADSAGDTCCTRASFAYIVNGKAVAPTAQNIAGMKMGDFICATSAPSKCDGFNLHWGRRKMWFRLDSRAEINFHSCLVGRV
eukprot:2368417-Pleurochrysis_carterae.AAC.2